MFSTAPKWERKDVIVMAASNETVEAIAKVLEKHLPHERIQSLLIDLGKAVLDTNANESVRKTFIKLSLALKIPNRP
jgi:hypothetical protein